MIVCSENSLSAYLHYKHNQKKSFVKQIMRIFMMCDVVNILHHISIYVMLLRKTLQMPFGGVLQSFRQSDLRCDGVR
jgi:tryptophan-rich sensory protein